MPCEIYIMGSMDGPKKIGMANNPAERAYRIRPASPLPIRVLYVCAMSDRMTAFAVEQTSHAILHESRIRGEWFAVEVAEAAHAIDVAANMVDHFRADHVAPEEAGEACLWKYVREKLMGPPSYGKRSWPTMDTPHAKRTKAALAAARARGRIGGRRSAVTDEQVLETEGWPTIRAMRALKFKSRMGYLRRLNQAKEAKTRERQECN